jgi:hypothetical protein
MPKRKANMRKRLFEKIETGSNKGKSGRLWTQKAQRLSKNVGNIVEPTKAPPEFLQEIGEYSKAEPYSPLAETIQKSLDRQKPIRDIAMMVASPIAKKKAAEKIYYHLTATKNVKNIKEKGFNPDRDTSFIRGGNPLGGSYQGKKRGLFLFTNPIAALKFAHGSDKYHSVDKKSIIPVKLKKGTVIKKDPSGDHYLGSDAMDILGLDKYANQSHRTHAIFISANNKKNIDNFLNKDIILGKGKPVTKLVENSKNPSRVRNREGNRYWYPQDRDVSDIVNRKFVANKQSKKQMQEYLKEIDKLLID